MRAAIPDEVHGNIALTNLDAGALTVESDLVTKKGKNGEAGTVTLEQEGEITVDGNVNASSDVKAVNSDGDILFLGSVTSGGSVSAKTDTGTIGYAENVKAQNAVTAEVTEKGDIMYLGNVESVRRGDIRASTKEGDIWYHKKVTSNAGSVIAETGAGRSMYGDTVRANIDVTATAETGKILYEGAVNAGRTIQATINKAGDIAYGKALKAGRDIIIDTKKGGDILFEGNVAAGRDFIFHTGKGWVTYNGRVTAGRNLPDQIRENWGKRWYYSDYPSGGGDEEDNKPGDDDNDFKMIGLLSKDLPEQICSGYEKIVYFDRYGLFWNDNSVVVSPFLNANDYEVETNGEKQ